MKIVYSKIWIESVITSSPAYTKYIDFEGIVSLWSLLRVKGFVIIISSSINAGWRCSCDACSFQLQ